MNADERRWGGQRSVSAGNRMLPINEITEKVIGCAFRVGNALGCGFLEKVYENALVHELRRSGLRAVQQYGIQVRYDGVVVGEYTADLLVEDGVLVELKAAKAIDDVMRAQCMNYLRATGLRVCLLINFGAPRVDVKRIVLEDEAHREL